MSQPVKASFSPSEEVFSWSHMTIAIYTFDEHALNAFFKGTVFMKFRAIHVVRLQWTNRVIYIHYLRRLKSGFTFFDFPKSIPDKKRNAYSCIFQFS